MGPLRTRLLVAAAVTLGLAAASLGAAPTAAGAASASASAAGHPVSPTVHRTPLAGVDAAALAGSPAALDPTALAAADQGQAVVPGRAAKDRRPAVLTAAMDTSRFEAAGVTWTGSTAKGVVVQVRLRERGVWSDWQALDAADGPDAGTAEARRAAGTVSTEPVASASADGIQVRVDTTAAVTAPAGLQLVTVDPGTSAADAGLTAAAPAASAAATGAAAPAGRPAIVTRAQWGADESLRTCSPTYSSTIKATFVHHTVNSNSYAPSESAGLVRAIYAYHVQGRGWCDIGYNFLVDRYGQVFEGRYGGMDRPVIGAHAGGFNTNSFGVSGIGDFTSVAPTAPMWAAYTAIIGWKLSLYGIDPQATTVLTSAGFESSPYPAGTPVTLRTISGHRDVNATGCPGDAFYPQLPSLAALVRSYVATTAAPSLVLNAGGVARSPSGRYSAVMQADGNLVVYGPAGASWATGTGVPYAYAAVQGDGNLVLYDRTDGTPLWASATSGLYAHLEMQDDGNLVLYAGSGAALWDSRGNTRHTGVNLPANKAAVRALTAGQGVSAPNGAYRLVMQTDGNLVEYDAAGRPRWWSGTGIPGSRLVQQPDGNLVVYSPQNRPVWSSGTASRSGAFTVIRNDGVLAVYGSDGALVWAV